MAKSSVRTKPCKPYPDFPLFPHATGRWAKKIRGKFHYFGKWGDPDAAIQRYLDEKDDLHAGRIPRVKGDALTIRDLCNRFLTAKRQLLDSGDIVETTFRNYYKNCERVVGYFGKSRLVENLVSEDFAEFRSTLSKNLGPSTLAGEVRNTQILFKWAYDAGLIGKPMRYGQSFNRPSKKVLRLARQANGARMFEADELRMIIEATDVPLRAMVLLAINCGFGQSDVANLPTRAIDLEQGWVEFPRPKTGIERRCALWPETVEAIRLAIKQRSTPNNPDKNGLAFITPCGEQWVQVSDSERRTWKDSIGKKYGKLLKRLGIKRRGLNFYAIRHTFETIGGESRDQVAVNAIMGHVDSTMAGVYRERISDERLRAVVDTVRSWLFGA